eukprot:CAMPEP_0117075412 /NCGR_PEP_ID=MMETSP0472-20121206/53167_1 /TAXON_ID=693140 ORGANISM="Tiarina fusus, Strain LIS" /NCGR_SAMPLE_ID=MMETSP0472 /ASSEMBLY_ACC=CAM_ASM_000603 /LENGTH=300 /DNA_ID=CAMNT_0004800905 /DNA_START=101 /DNA_END=1001 /DNA_ORIENTATION=-
MEVSRSILLMSVLALGAFAIPMQVTVNQRQNECLYDKLEEGEYVTMSVFLLSGANLKATATLEGPIAPNDVSSALELYEGGEQFSANGEQEVVRFKTVVDFEHLSTGTGDDDEEDEEPIDAKDPDALEKRRQRREKQREAFLLAKQKREEKRILQQKKLREDGEPFQYTTKATKAGWYKACVQATFTQVVAEIELRKASELGGLDDSGHIRSYESKAAMDEDTELEKDTASQEGIKDEDFEETRDKIKDLRRLLNEIQSMQQKERRRLSVHAETNEHSQSRMALSSLLETLLFMAVTGFQ